MRRRAGAEGVRDAVSTMRAMVFHGPGDLRDERVPVPEPAAGEVVLRIDAALTCGTDVKTLRRGHPVMIPHVPTVFGHEFAGTVAAVGAGVRGVREGDRAVARQLGAVRELPARAGPAARTSARTCSSSTAPTASSSRCRRAWSQSNLVRLAGHASGRPRGVRRAAGVRAGWRSSAARVEAGQTVVVFGHGPLGCLLGDGGRRAEGARDHGRQAGLAARAVAGLGIGEVLDATATPDVADAVRAATGGRGAEVTVDATGRPEVWAAGRRQRWVAEARCYSLVDARPARRSAWTLAATHYEELTLLGAFHHTPELIRRAVELLESDAIEPEGLISTGWISADVRAGAGADGHRRGVEGARSNRDPSRWPPRLAGAHPGCRGARARLRRRRRPSRGARSSSRPRWPTATSSTSRASTISDAQSVNWRRALRLAAVRRRGPRARSTARSRWAWSPSTRRYFEPKPAHSSPASALTVRYHFLSLGRFVPYVEGGGGRAAPISR